MWFSPGTLTPAMRLSAYILEADVRDQIDRQPYLDAIELVSQADGLINYRRDGINVLDRAKLEERVCEC